MKSASTKNDHKIAEEALRQIGKSGWDKFKPPAQFANKNAILPLITAALSEQTFKNCSKLDKSVSVHDRLFEVLMARFDVIQQHRKAILSIAEAARRDVSMLFVLGPAHKKAMADSLRFAFVPESKTCPQLQPLGLWGVFMFTAHVWKGDETVDMSKTMAALDRALRLAGKAVTIFRA